MWEKVEATRLWRQTLPHQKAQHRLICISRCRLWSDANQFGWTTTPLRLGSMSLFWILEDLLFVVVSVIKLAMGFWTIRSLENLSDVYYEQSLKSLLEVFQNLRLFLLTRTHFRRLKENKSLWRAPFSSRGVETKPSLSPLVAILKCLYWSYSNVWVCWPIGYSARFDLYRRV